MQEKIIYSKWLAYKLREQGFRILRTEVNPNKPQYDCWVFEDNDNFQKAFLSAVEKR